MQRLRVRVPLSPPISRPLHPFAAGPGCRPCSGRVSWSADGSGSPVRRGCHVPVPTLPVDQLNGTEKRQAVVGHESRVRYYPGSHTLRSIRVGSLALSSLSRTNAETTVQTSRRSESGGATTSDQEANEKHNTGDPRDGPCHRDIGECVGAAAVFNDDGACDRCGRSGRGGGRHPRSRRAWGR